VTWTSVAVVAVVAIVVPAARSRLADRAASWLRDEWTLSSSYDDARFGAIVAVGNLAGALDDAIVERAARLTDHEEAAALQRIADAMARHWMWSSNGDHARDAAVAALRDEIASLNLDARARHPSTGYLLVTGNGDLASRASTSIAALARRDGLGKAMQPPSVSLRPDETDLARLRTTTDFRTGLSLVLSGPRGPQIVDLDTGHATPLHVRTGESGITFWAGHIVVADNRGVDAFDAHAHLVRHFAVRNAEVLSTTGPTLWLKGQKGVRQFAANGRPLTPWIALPPDRSAAMATGDAVVLVHVLDELRLDGELWTPTTGARRELPASCFGGWVAAARTVVTLPCGGDRVVTSVDAVTGAVQRTTLPGHVDESAAETFNPLSPSGTLLTVGIAHLGVRSGLVDLRSGHFQPSPGNAALSPVAWSTDGSWVLLADVGSFGNGRKPALALWHPQDGRRTSVRLPPGDSLLGGTQLLTTSGR
jgi:hypothetical protein